MTAVQAMVRLGLTAHCQDMIQDYSDPAVSIQCKLQIGQVISREIILSKLLAEKVSGLTEPFQGGTWRAGVQAAPLFEQCRGLKAK